MDRARIPAEAFARRSILAHRSIPEVDAWLARSVDADFGGADDRLPSLSQFVRFEHMPEVQDRRLVRDRIAAEFQIAERAIDWIS
jgi:hypothetical protein